MTEDKQRLMQELKDEIAIRCLGIEELCRSYGLPLSKITVIARDPTNAKMYTCVTNESEGGLAEACGLALQPPATITR
jgi:hypothetical protein